MTSLMRIGWIGITSINAPEGYGVDLLDMEDIGFPKAVDATVMMMVARPGHERQELLSYSLPAADMVITEPVADILIVGHDVPVVAESPDHQNTFDPDLLNTFETVCGMHVYYGGDLNDSNCESVGDHVLDTWEDWCDSDLWNRYYGFPPDTEDAQPPIIFSAQVFRGEDMVEPSRVRPDFWELQVISDPGVTLVPPNTDRINEIVSNKLATSRCFPWVFVIRRSVWVLWMGMSWLSAHVTLGYQAVTRSGLMTYYVSCFPPARGMRGTFPL